MKKVFIFLLFGITALSCNRPELKVDSYFATVKLVGREVCASDTSLSYWIFDVIRIGYGDSTDVAWGKSLTLNDSVYRRAIKTRELPVYYVSPTVKYQPVFFNQKYVLEYDLYDVGIINCFRDNKINTLPEVKLRRMSITN